jgi:8-oxo-dGTP pyrophosphatase MutT (NUDIX family)
MEADETAEQALLRELSEEIGLSPRPLVYFSRFQYDMDFAGAGVIDRLYFETSSTAREVSGLRVAEGRRLGLFSPTELASLRMTPYDSFCLWLHANRARIGHAAR